MSHERSESGAELLLTGSKTSQQSLSLISIQETKSMPNILIRQHSLLSLFAHITSYSVVVRFSLTHTQPLDLHLSVDLGVLT